MFRSNSANSFLVLEGKELRVRQHGRIVSRFTNRNKKNKAGFSSAYVLFARQDTWHEEIAAPHIATATRLIQWFWTNSVFVFTLFINGEEASPHLAFSFPYYWLMSSTKRGIASHRLMIKGSKYGMESNLYTSTAVLKQPSEWLHIRDTCYWALLHLFNDMACDMTHKTAQFIITLVN